MANKSYYSDKFIQLSSYKLINELPLENSDGLRPDLNLEDTIDAKFFRLGSQEFIQNQPPLDKVSRLVLGDIRDEGGRPIGFSVGMAMLCLYASNYAHSTRQHLTTAIHDFLHDEDGNPRIKDMSVDNYLTIVKLQKTLNLPLNSLTRFVANAKEIEQELGPLDNVIYAYKKNFGVCHTIPDENGSLKVNKILREIVDPRQYDLFDEQKNEQIKTIAEQLNAEQEISNSLNENKNKNDENDLAMQLLDEVINSFNNETQSNLPEQIEPINQNIEQEIQPTVSEAEIPFEVEQVAEIEDVTNDEVEVALENETFNVENVESEVEVNHID